MWEETRSAASLLLLAALGTGCRGAPVQPCAELWRLAPAPHVAVDGFGVAFPFAGRDCEKLAFTSAGDVHVLDRATGETLLASVSSSGQPGNLASGWPVLSGDRRAVAFGSAARDLVPGDRNRHDDVFVRDLRLETTERVSVSSAGIEANDANLGLAPGLALDGSGRLVAWGSQASNLVPDDTNAASDVFVHDRRSGETTRVNVSSQGSQASGDSFMPSLSADGALVAFASDATDLVAGDRNRARDVFVRDRRAHTTRRVSLSDAGAEADGPSDFAAISADGRFVAFASDATNLVSDDGNGVRDVFVRDLAAMTTARIGPSIDRHHGAEPDGPSDLPAISADGRRLAFVSRATNLVALDGNALPDVFLVDREAGWILRVSEPSGGGDANEESGIWRVSLSADGSCVAFESYADNLLAGDDNARMDVFVYELPRAR